MPKKTLYEQRQVWNEGGSLNLHNRSILQSKTWNTEMDKGFVLEVISQALSMSALSLTHHENVILYSTFLIVVLVFACTSSYKHWHTRVAYYLMLYFNILLFVCLLYKSIQNNPTVLWLPSKSIYNKWIVNRETCASTVTKSQLQ